MPKWKSSGVTSRPKSDAVMAIAINSSGTCVAAGHFDGTVVGYDSTNVSAVRFCFNVSEERRRAAAAASSHLTPSVSSPVEEQIQEKFPVTALAFKPHSGDGGDDQPEVLLIATSDGTVERCRMKRLPTAAVPTASSPSPASSSSLSSPLTSPHQQSLMPSTFSSDTIRERIIGSGAGGTFVNEEEREGDSVSAPLFNEVYAACYSPDGTRFATCGLDGTVRVYDDATFTLTHVLRSSSSTASSGGGSSGSLPPRLQAVRFGESNPNIVIAAGWGQSLHFWDLGIATEGGGAAGLEQQQRCACVAGFNNDGSSGATSHSDTNCHSNSHQYQPSAARGPTHRHEEVYGPFMIGQGIAVSRGEVLSVSYRGGPDRLQRMPEPTTVGREGGGGRKGSAAPSRPATATATATGLRLGDAFMTATHGGGGVSAGSVSAAAAPGGGGPQFVAQRLTSLPWPTSASNLNFFPTCVATSPSSPASSASDAPPPYFIAMGGGGGMGLTEALMIVDGSSSKDVVAAEYLAVGCVNCCAFGALRRASASSPTTHPAGALLVAFGDSKGNVHFARYA